MRMDCCKCGIFEKLFPVNHAKIYACCVFDREKIVIRFSLQSIVSAQDRTGDLARDDHYTTETCMPKDVRRLPILSQMWKIYVGENYLIDHAKSLRRSI
jgi:hypothetical protein